MIKDYEIWVYDSDVEEYQLFLKETVKNRIKETKSIWRTISQRREDGS